ncbi:MAG TPA: YfiR family protein [Chthonomonadaceae bacterium]|nr:YfiR family protein [Chthonomonadaceae bacterium]
MTFSNQNPSRRFRLRLLWALLPVLILLLAGSASPAQEGGSREYEIKAAFIYNFVKYVDWPSDPGPNIVLGVYGKDPFGSALDAVNGKTVRGKTLVVRRLSDRRDITRVQILFICNSEKDRLRSILDSLRGDSVLTIGEMPNFAQNGGIIGFRNENNKVRFDIDPDAAEHARLKISSYLLRLARIVHG